MAGNHKSGRRGKPNSRRTSVHVDNDVYGILKDVGNGSISRGVELLAYEKQFGQVVYDGRAYTLTGQAEPTSRLLPEPSEGLFEMSAPALDWYGNLYTVYWIFERRYTPYTDPETGEPMAVELDEYDYSHPDRVVKP